MSDRESDNQTDLMLEGGVFAHDFELDRDYVMQTYARFPVEFVSGNGMTLLGADGRSYTDFMAGIGVVSMGHVHPRITKALTDQAEKLLHVSNLYYVEHRGELARELSSLLGSGKRWKTFFANSGAEANEGAIKLARRWAKTHRGEEAFEVITADRSFHGRTLATLAATAQGTKQERFAPLPAGFSSVPLNDLAALETAITEKTAAVMLECIQGEGGVYPCEPAYLRGVRELCDEAGVLLMIDEVQTGMFRTGLPFAFQHFDIVPDVVTVAKGMGNGVPIGGVCATEDVAASFEAGDHGSTFGGGPLVCAASLATIRAMQEEDIAANVTKVGAYAREVLASLPDVVEIRGLGLMVGIELASPIAREVTNGALADGFLIGGIGEHIIRLLPPLICKESDVDALFTCLHERIQHILEVDKKEKAK